MNFKPVNVARWLIWSGFAFLLVIAPLIFNKGASLSLLSQMGTVMIFGLSYNMLLGQGGMLSFGHAVYSGLGAFFAIHAMNLAERGSLPIPVSLMPLVGGLAGICFWRAVRLCDYEEIGHDICYDYAWCGRIGVCLILDVSGFLRRRGRD